MVFSWNIITHGSFFRMILWLPECCFVELNLLLPAVVPYRGHTVLRLRLGHLLSCSKLPASIFPYVFSFLPVLGIMLVSRQSVLWIMLWIFHGSFVPNRTEIVVLSSIWILQAGLLSAASWRLLQETLKFLPGCSVSMVMLYILDWMTTEGAFGHCRVSADDFHGVVTLIWYNLIGRL